MKKTSLKNQEKINSTYILATGNQGVSNLDLQNEIFKKKSFK